MRTSRLSVVYENQTNPTSEGKQKNISSKSSRKITPTSSRGRILRPPHSQESANIPPLINLECKESIDLPFFEPYSWEESPKTAPKKSKREYKKHKKYEKTENKRTALAP